jgi:hypothetical protein
MNKNSKKYTKYGENKNEKHEKSEKKYILKNDLGVFYVSII